MSARVGMRRAPRLRSQYAKSSVPIEEESSSTLATSRTRRPL
jgi:hypothetical protein